MLLPGSKRFDCHPKYLVRSGEIISVPSDSLLNVLFVMLLKCIFFLAFLPVSKCITFLTILQHAYYTLNKPAAKSFSCVYFKNM